MDFLGIGPLEFLLILLIAFLFFGPEKLPELAVKAGRIYRNVKKSYSQLSKTITEEIAAERKKSSSSEIPDKTSDTANNP